MKNGKEKYYSYVTDKESKTVEILIYGVIGDSWFEESTTAKQFVSEFRKLEKEYDRINIRLNSPGGSCFDGLAICNAISQSKKEIHTYNDGLCASMAAVILLSVSPENVHPAKNSLLMIHSPSTGAWGNKRQIEDAITILDKVQKSLVTTICAMTGKEDEEVEKLYFDYQDHWFTTDEANEAGLYLYSSIEDYEAENIPQNASTMKFSDLVRHFEPSDTLFQKRINRETLENKNSIETHMDITLLREAYSLPEDSTEADILDHINNREKEISDLKQAKEKAENELATAKKSLEDKDAEIAALSNEAGEKPATAIVETDAKPKTGDPEPAKDFGNAFATCMEILKNRR